MSRRYVRTDERIGVAIKKTRAMVRDAQRPTGTEKARTMEVAAQAATDSAFARDLAERLETELGPLPGQLQEALDDAAAALEESGLARSEAATAVAAAQSAAAAASEAIDEALAATALVSGSNTWADRAPTSGDAEGKPLGAIWFEMDGSGLLAGFWELQSVGWISRDMSESVIPQIAIGAGTYGELSGSRLVARSILADHIKALAITANELAADSVTAVKIAAGSVTAEKISAGAVTTDKLDALAVTADKIAAGAIIAEKIAAGAITTAKLSADAIDGMTITGATVRGGTIEQFGDSASVGTHKHPTTTAAAPGWKEAGLGTMTVLTVTVGSSTRAVRASRSPAGTCAVTWDIPNIYAGAVIKVRMRVRRPQAGAAFLSGMTLPIGPEVQQVPANTWTTIETPEFLCTGDSWMTVGFYNTAWGDATEAEVIVVTPGTTTTTMENTPEYGPALVWRAGGETTAVYRSGSIALRSINPLPGGEHTMVLNSGGIRMNAGVGGGIDPLQFAKQITTDTHLNIRADGHIRVRPGVGHEVVILERGHIVPGDESNFNRHIVFQQATGAITQIGSTGVYGRTLTAELPIVLDEFEWITLMPLSIGNGYGQAFLAGMTREATFTRVTYRFLQTGSNTQQTLTMLASVIRQSPSIG